ncbi:MAG: hypothetical protein HY842_11075 [Bacteroidetes bacterium]|nr:hypothetical protein [Bacteroidota bacterium]
MVTSHDNERTKKTYWSALRYWLAWALVVAVLGYGLHRYFEHRNQELDKRLEQIRG